MSAPSFGTIGTLHGATTSTPAFAVPASVASGDIIVVAFYADVSTTTISAFPSGFAEAENSPVAINPGNPGNHCLHVAWKRASAADTGTYSFTLSASVFVYGNAVRYPGAVAAGNPWDSPTASAQGGNVNSTTTPDVAVTTAGPDRLLIFVGTSFGGDGGTWTVPTGFNQRQGGTNTTNCEISDLVQAVQGGSGNTHATSTASDKVGSWLGALIGTTSSAAAAGPLPRPPRQLFDQLARDYQSRFRPADLPPVIPVFVPPSIGARRSIAAAIRLPRGQFFAQPPTAQVVVTPPTFVPPQLGVRHPTVPSARLPRGRFAPMPPVAPGVVPAQIGARRPLAPRWARGRFMPLPATIAAPIPNRLTGRPVRPVAIRRGQIFPVPVPVVVVTQTGPLVPRITRMAIHWAGAIRRGKIFSIGAPSTNAPPRTARPTMIRWPSVARRGQIFSVPVPPTVIAPTGPVIPKTTRLVIHWPGPVRRGKIFFIPSSSQAAPSVTPVPPRMIQQHQQTRVLVRRGKITPVFGGQPGWVPPPTRPSSPVGARGVRPGMTPRGRRWITPTTPTGPIPRPPIGPARRILAVRPPRGRFLPMPYPPAVVVPPPLYVARIMRQRARFWFFARRGRLQFTRLTGAFGFPAEFISVSSALDMIGADSATQLITNASVGSAEFASGDRGVTFVDGDTGTELRSGP